MKIGKRIFISNTFMVFVSLMTLLIIGGSMIELQQIGDSEVDQTIFQVESILKHEEGKVPDWPALSTELADYGYQLYVAQDESVVYSNVDHRQDEITSYLQTVKLSSDLPRAFFGDGVATIDQLITIGDKTYHVIAINPNYDDERFDTSQNQPDIFLIRFLLIGLASIAVIMLISQLFTKQLVKRIMIPIHKLTEGAKRIEEGDLSIPIDYKGEDEFETVCASFNQMQTHLKEEQDKIAIYEKARTDMISSISHDLRTPLTSVKGYIKGVRDGIANTPEKQAQYLSIAYKKACDMDVLLQRLFYFSKLETGNLPFFSVDTDLAEFTHKFVLDIKDDLEQKNAVINYVKSDGSHPVLIDTEQMRQVLANLVENALKYAGAESLKISVSVTQENENEVLCFADNGNGVSLEKLPHLFEQFYRGDESRNNKNSDSNGLGLYIVKYIIEAQGGSVFAENNQGLKFTITLPRRKESEHA